MQSGKKPRIGFLSVLFCLVSMLLVACGGGSTSTTTSTHGKAPDNKQVLVSGLEAGTADIKTLDPGLMADSFSLYAVQNVFTGLVQLDDNLNLKMQLAACHRSCC